MVAIATCYIGLGSNLGSSVDTLKSALADLNMHPKIALKQSSRLYGSKPQGPKNQPDFVNAVAEIDTSLTPHKLLDALQSIETSHNRIRTGQHWGPRTLDLDLLLYGNRVIETQRLTVPHAHLLERSFVLYPLAEIKNDLIFPNGSALTDYLSSASDPTGVMDESIITTISRNDLWVLEK